MKLTKNINFRLIISVVVTWLESARSMPLAELQQGITELPVEKPVVAYCRGPFCVMSDVALSC